MKIMVIGNGTAVTHLCAHTGETGDRDNSQVVHYRDPDQALRDLDRGVESYGWVLIDSGCRDAYATAASVNARHSRLPVAVFNPVQNGQAIGTAAKPALCAVETTDDGLQILRCALHRASQEPGGRETLRDAIDAQPIVFEYHAPCRKSR